MRGRGLRLRLPRLANRWRFTLRVLAAVVVVAAVSGLVAVRAVESKFTAEVDADLRKEVRGLVAAAEVIDLDRLAALADQPGFARNDQALLILGPDGIDVAIPSGSSAAPDPLPDVADASRAELRAGAGEPFEVAAVDGSLTYRAIVAQLDDGRLAMVANPLTGLEGAVRTVVQALLLSALGASLVLAVTIALVSGHVTRPLDAMIDTAEAIGSGTAVGRDDLRARVATDGVEDVARLGRALNAMLDRLERAFADREASEEALRRFVADASHELRTPLAAVLGYAELHQEGMARRPEQVDHAMARIAVEGERMRMLVDELLLLAQLDESRPMERGPVDLGALVTEAVAGARALDPDRSVALAVDVSGGADRLVVAGDGPSLRQAVDNLLANTRAHTPPSTSVEVTVAPGDDGTVAVTVADDGPGLDPADVPHVFERFFRAERSRARPGGSGLGLAIVAAVAEAHGGRATVASELDRGTAFTLTVPA